MPLESPLLVGRAAEANLLAGCVAAARGGNGSAAFLVGEPGIGKSRLAGPLPPPL